MTDYKQEMPKQALGIGSLFSESISIFGRKFFSVIAIGTVSNLLGLIISGTILGYRNVLGISDLQSVSQITPMGFVLSTTFGLAIFAISTAVLTQLAYDAKLNRPVQITRYFAPALSCFIPVVVLTLLSSVLTGIGLILLIVPGLWIGAVFFVVVPSIIIDRVGFGGFGRSASLTRGYRWAIVLLLLLIFVCLLLLGFLAGFVSGFAFVVSGVPLAIVLRAIVTALSTGLLSILVALTYARLREIKEGVTVDQMASVFE